MTTRTARPSRRDWRDSRGWPARCAYYGCATIIALGFLFPLVWTVTRSLQGPAGDGVPTPGSLVHLTLANYRALSGSGDGLWRYVTNSAVIGIATAAGTVLVSMPAGYGLSRLRFRGSGVVFLILLTPFMVPFQGILTPMFAVLSRIHLTDSLVGLILLYITFQLPFAVFVMRNSFAQIPQAIEEAALLDGAGTLGVLVRVMTPLVLPGIVTVALFAFLFGWNEFLAALILLTTDQNFTLPIALSNLQVGLYGQVDFGILDAGAVVAMLPCLAVFLVLQRYYLRGLAAGAVK